DVLFATVPGKSEAETEDLVSADCYWAAIESEVGVTLPRNEFARSRKKWSDALARQLERKNQVLTDPLKRRLKELVRNCALRDAASGLRSDQLLSGLRDLLLSRLGTARSSDPAHV